MNPAKLVLLTVSLDPFLSDPAWTSPALDRSRSRGTRLGRGELVVVVPVAQPVRRHGVFPL